MQAVGQPNWSSLAGNLAVVVGGVLIMNGLIFGLGWARDEADRPASLLVPPGWVVGLVWTVLFALLAVARWQVSVPARSGERAWITGLILFCLVYPLYALAPHSMAAAFVGNLATIALASVVVGRVWGHSRPAALCIAPIVPWVAFATVTILVDWGWFGGSA